MLLSKVMQALSTLHVCAELLGFCSLLMSTVSYMKTAVYLQGLAVWLAYASNRAKLRKALLHLRYATASRAFLTWRACAAELAQHARQLVGAALMWSHCTQAAAFRAWVQHHAMRQSQTQMVRHWASNLASPGVLFYTLSLGVVSTWCSRSIQSIMGVLQLPYSQNWSRFRRGQFMQVATAIDSWRNQAMRRACSAWLLFVEARHDQRAAVEAALMRLMHSLEAAAFAAWHEHARLQAELRARVAHALHAMHHQVTPST